MKTQEEKRLMKQAEQARYAEVLDELFAEWDTPPRRLAISSRGNRFK